MNYFIKNIHIKRNSQNVCLKSNNGFVVILPKIRNKNVFNLT